MQRLRSWAYLTAVPSVVGVVILAIGDEFNLGMLWLLTPAFLAGLVLSPRFYPLELIGAKATARMNALWKRTFIDLAWLSLGYLVILIGWAVAVQFIEPDGSAFGLAPLLALFCGGAALLGTLTGMVVVLPVIALVEQSRAARRGEPANRPVVAGAVLLLSGIIFVVTLVAASSIESSGSSRGRGLTAVFVVLTGLQTDEDRITSEPLAWVARIAFIVLVASGIALYRLSRGPRRPKPEE